ncbi:MAG: hypothetical protein SFU86_13360 [Pirellulaceae bacterium]|nr:hypothetical protein [Pirellulaceae bacterium]
MSLSHGRYSFRKIPIYAIVEPAVAKNNQAEVEINRREKSERRGNDRRKSSEPVVVERRQTTERRAKVQRRRQIDPTTCEREYSAEEIEFMAAMDAYKRSSGRMFPTCSEILEVIRGMGYVRLAQQTDPTLAGGVGSQVALLETPSQA